MRTHTLIDGPVGPLTIMAGDGQIRCLYMDLQRHRPHDSELGEPDPHGRQAQPFTSTANQLDAYLAGQRTCFRPAFGTPWIRVPATGLGCAVLKPQRRRSR